MKVSMRTEYGLRGIVTLAERQREGGGRPVPLSEVAQAEGIPEAFLEQIFAGLRREGLVASVRGARGGYLLTREPESIRMGEIVALLEGNLAPIGCVSSEFADPVDFCERVQSCHTRSVWVKLNATILRTLDSISLADIIADESVVR